MRIVLVVPGGVDPPGGSRVIPFIHHLVERLGSRHDLLVVAVGHDEELRSWELFGSPVINIPTGTHSRSDVVRVVGSVSRNIGRHGRPDVVHGLWANLPGLSAMIAARRFRVPSVVSVCGGELACHPDIGYGGGLTAGTRRLSLTSLRGATAATAATEWMRRHVTDAGGRVDEIVPLGADQRCFATVGKSASASARLVHIAGLNRVKNQDLLLRAVAIIAAEVPEIRLDIAGDDTLDGHHRRLAEALGIASNVHFHGHVHHDALGDLVGQATVHVLSSRHDAGPLAVLEAAACGVPTIGTEVGHVADLAALPQPGAVVVAGRSPEAFAAAVIEVLGDRRRRDALAEAAERWARQHDAEHTVASFEALYRRLAARS